MEENCIKCKWALVNKLKPVVRVVVVLFCAL